MESDLTIGKIGRLVELPTKTIRFYEEIGLIAAAKRAKNGYRMYEKHAVEELKMIKYARDLGLPIEIIKKLMRGCKKGNCHHSRGYILSEINNYVSLLNEKILQMTNLKQELQTMKIRMRTKNEHCNDKTKYCCNIFHQLISSKGGE